MAAETEELPWDDQTDIFISNIDKSITKTYGLSIRELLLDPDKFTGTKDILDTLTKIRGNVDDYFTGLRDSMVDEKASFTKALENADMQYNKINEAISTKTSFSRIPYIEPYDIKLNSENQEEIVIDQYNNAVDALVTKLVNVSNYVGNISSSYDKYTMGSWIFSGQKVYMLSVYLPPSIISEMDSLNSQIDDLIDTAYQQIRLNLGK
jgi:hypothetical protein